MEDKALRGANELEKLLPHLQEIVDEIRTRKVGAYAAMYEARGRMSAIVARLGAGYPPKSGHNWEAK